MADIKTRDAVKGTIKDTLYSVKWLPADITLIEKIEQQMK